MATATLSPAGARTATVHHLRRHGDAAPESICATLLDQVRDALAPLCAEELSPVLVRARGSESGARDCALLAGRGLPGDAGLPKTTVTFRTALGCKVNVLRKVLNGAAVFEVRVQARPAELYAYWQVHDGRRREEPDRPLPASTDQNRARLLDDLAIAQRELESATVTEDQFRHGVADALKVLAPVWIANAAGAGDWCTGFALDPATRRQLEAGLTMALDAIAKGRVLRNDAALAERVGRREARVAELRRQLAMLDANGRRAAFRVVE